MKSTKTKLLKSALALLMVAAMLVGSTFAWFTDAVTSKDNVIQTGSLDVEMYWTDDLNSGNWHNVEDAAYNTIFTYNNWEPGYTDVKYIKLVNNGDLAMNYKLSLTAQGSVGKLAEVINVYFADSAVAMQSQDDLSQLNAIGLLSNVMNGGSSVSGTLLAADQQSPLHPSGEVIMTVAMHMITTAGNECQGETSGEFTVTALATQAAVEKDAFGADYDAGAEYPEILVKGDATAAVTPVDGKVPAGGVTLQGSTVSAFVPEGVVLEDGAKELTLTVTPLEGTTSDITVVNNEILIPVDVHIAGVAASNTVPIVINLGEVLPKYLNMGNYSLFHVENGANSVMTLVDSAAALTAHNSFTYDPMTGAVSVAMATFSEVAIVADTDAGWEGEDDYSWYNAEETALTIANADQLAAFGKIVGGMADDIERDSFEGKTVTLLSDINLADGEENNNNVAKIFHPIGYYYKDGDSTVKSFEGTFDGNGHKVANFYQNTWEIEGDYDGTYYKDAMGLFGYVVDGTIKNLTVDNVSSDGEFTPTGVIAAYAVNSTFENIAITNCNPRVYNTGNGGIIGIAGRVDANITENIVLKNITVDNSNKISALWGSYDVACGGLVGMFRGNVDDSKDTIHFENCHVSAILDVYNDVCGNYQYYAYRYAGMIIGSIRHNTTNADGKTIPNMTGISATGCTVNYGDWNDYYYCELVNNTLASYTHDHQFSRLTKVDTLPGSVDGTAHYYVKNQDGTITCRHFINGKLHKHEDSGTEIVDGKTVLKEDKTCVYLPFTNQLFTGYSWGVSNVGIEKWQGFDQLGITEGDQEESVVKFESAFPNSSVDEKGIVKTAFVYRVGNHGAVPVNKLFKTKDGQKINSTGVWVTVQKISDTMNVSGSFAKSTTNNWEDGTITFSGTGVVKVTIQDYNYCTPTVLYLEVVDAVNATTATSATKNNVVLLNDCGFSSLEVSGGYTLYGNGFTMTCGSDSAALDMGYSFVTLNNGTLDNVQIVTPNFDYAVLYKSNMTESGNRSETTDRTRYFNVKSGVMVSGNSQILNSRVSGGRAAVNVTGGDCLIDNSRIELGAVASLLVGSANSLTLRDVSLVQKPTASTYDSSKTLMGFSVLCVCDANGDAAPITIEGELVQYAWIDENDKQYVPSAGQSIVSTVLGQTEYLHDLNDDGTKESLNLGFAYMPESLTSKVNTTTITDNRTNKDTVPYDYSEVSILSGKTYVYSYKNTNGTADSFKTEAEYAPNKQGDIITVTYGDNADGLESSKSFGAAGWVYELNVDLDKLSGYKLDFSKLSMSVNGTTVNDFKVNGAAKPSSPVAVAAGGTTYTLTAIVNGTEHTVSYKVTGTETSKESPTLVAANYEAGLCVASSYGGTWSGAAPALEGIQIKYWSVAEQQYKTINLSDYTPTTKGQLNGTNTTWTYSPANGDFTLTLTGGQVHSSNNVYAMPVVCNGKLYFVAAKSNGLVNSGNAARTVPVSYSFKDNNGGDVLTFSHTWSVAENKDEQYKYSDFCNGTLTKLEKSSSPCVTPDTLVTLADGTQKRIDQVTYEDQLLVWNFYEGKYDVAPIAIIFDHGADNNTVIELNFSDGTTVKAVNMHQFFDANLNELVTINKDTVKDYVGHKFAKHSGNTTDSVELVSYSVSNEYVEAWGIMTAEHYNIITEGMISADFDLKDVQLFNYFEVGDDMKFDETKMQADIEKYGLYTYNDFADCLTPEQFVAFNVQYFKIPVEKGLYTYEGILDLIEQYLK